MNNLNLDTLIALCENMPRPVPMMLVVGHPLKLREFRQRIPLVSTAPLVPMLDIAFHSPSVSFIESEHCMMRKQVRFSRSKRKRIRKKWRNQEKNFAMTPTAYIMNEDVLGTIPKIMERQIMGLNGI